jgi:hypothetical protein
VQNEKPLVEKKQGAAIYLSSPRPPQMKEFASDFRTRWPGVPLKSEGQQGNCVYVGVGDSRMAVEFRPVRVPDGVTSEAAVSAQARHWPTVARDLAPHQAHLAIAASHDGGNVLNLAADLTKAVTSLLSVSDSIGVAWLNGPVVNAARDFVGIASEMFEIDALPLILWIAIAWNPEAHLVHTKGMAQFGAAELFLAEQPEPATEMVAYLFDLANYVLTSGNVLLEGETIDGPKGVLRIQSLSGVESGKRGLMLFPVRPN